MLECKHRFIKVVQRFLYERENLLFDDIKQSLIKKISQLEKNIK